MKLEQIYTGCMAIATYDIESNREAAIIDTYSEKRVPKSQNTKGQCQNHIYIRDPFLC